MEKMSSATSSSSPSPVHDTEIDRHTGTRSTAPSSSQSPVRDTEIVQHTGSTSTAPPFSQWTVRDTKITVLASELTSHTNLSPQQPRMPEGVSDNYNTTNEASWRRPLYHALFRQDGDAIDQILQTNPEAINGPVGEDKDTPLVLAIRNALGLDIIKKLVDLTPEEKLAACSPYGQSALEWAILNDNLPVSEMLLAKRSDLVNIRGTKMRILPMEYAASEGHRMMTSFLQGVTYLDMVSKTPYSDMVSNYDEDGNAPDLLQCVVASGMYDYALHLLCRRSWTWKYIFALDVLVEASDAFPSGARLSRFWSMIYWCVSVAVKSSGEDLEQYFDSQVIREIPSRFQTRADPISTIVLRNVKKMLVWPIKNIRDLKLKHCEVLVLVSSLCKAIQNSEEENLSGVVGHRFISAIQNGILEIVKEIIELFPDAINYADDDGNNALQLAVVYRHEKIFQVLHQQIGRSERHLMNHKNGDGNNILHLVSMRPRRTRLDATSRVVLKMQRELQWYKGLEKLVPSQLRNQKNTAGKTPLEIFDEEHQDMLASEGEWMRSMANSCIVGGSLIAAVVFAAAITVPGGTKGDNGLPYFSKDKAFKVFAFSDAFALVSSLTAVVIFLSIFTTRYSVNDFLYGLPNRLIIGLISLLLSVTFMMIAFSATAYIMYAEDNPGIFYPTVAVACIPVIFFSYLQLPSLLNMIKCTYGPNIFKQKGKMLSHSRFL